MLLGDWSVVSGAGRCWIFAWLFFGLAWLTDVGCLLLVWFLSLVAGFDAVPWCISVDGIASW
jgi:hypothetical protein